jgi:hypothetical protein
MPVGFSFAILYLIAGGILAVQVFPASGCVKFSRRIALVLRPTGRKLGEEHKERAESRSKAAML